MIIRGGTVVTARGLEKADIAIAGDRITAVGADLDADPEEFDATGLHVFPGGIDSHVHFNGRTSHTAPPLFWRVATRPSSTCRSTACP